MDINVGWDTFKDFITVKESELQFIDEGSKYYLHTSDRAFGLYCMLPKTDPRNSEQEDFEDNFKSSGNPKVLDLRDSDGSPLYRLKVTKAGWHYQLHGLEFITSTLNSIYSKNSTGDDLGYATIKCYNAEGTLLLNQEDCDAHAVRTVVDWEPTHDYEIVGGSFKQMSKPSENVRLWILGVPDVPAVSGGSKEFVSSVNLRYISGEAEGGVRSDGRTPKYMTYNALYHTNKFRMILVHPAGYKHPSHMMFDIFKS